VVERGPSAFLLVGHEQPAGQSHSGGTSAQRVRLSCSAHGGPSHATHPLLEA
jgi:hypothetical protein